MPWEVFADALRRGGLGHRTRSMRLVAAAVPADDDRLDLDHLDRPLRGRRFATEASCRTT